MRIKLWGARGSLATPLTPGQIQARAEQLLRGFFRAGHRDKRDISPYLKSIPPSRLGGFGGNTTCVEVSTGGSRVVIDAGTGIRELGVELMQSPLGRGKGEMHLVFSHFHWDHIAGLPFFTPIFIPGNVLHLYAVQPELEETIRSLFRKPVFPVPFEKLGAKVVFHRLQPRKPHTIGDITFTPYLLDHPDPCWGFKVENGGKAFAHCVDTECTRVSRKELGEDLPLYQGVDLMLFDAQYTLMEAIDRMNWGHAAAPMGLDIALREGIPRVIFMHHDPNASDDQISAAEKHARQYDRIKSRLARERKIPRKNVDWSYAVEGMEIEV